MAAHAGEVPERDSAGHPIIVVARRRENDPINVSLRRNRDEIRLKTVAYRLEVANADVCKGKLLEGDPVRHTLSYYNEMETGMVVHDLSYYDANVRDHYAKLYEMTYGFAVLAVVPNSAASVAGLKSGDQITGMDGVDLLNFHKVNVVNDGYYQRTGWFIRTLDHKLQSGPVVLTVHRDDDELLLTIKGEQGCIGDVRLESERFDDNEDFNRYAGYDGFSEFVTPKVVEITKSDDELAFIVAHLIAHNITSDFFKQYTIKSKVDNYGISIIKKVYHTTGLSPSETPAAELAADTRAVNMMSRAHYNSAASIDFINRAAQAEWLAESEDHPAPSRRIANINAAIAQIPVGLAMKTPSAKVP